MTGGGSCTDRQPQNITYFSAQYNVDFRVLRDCLLYEQTFCLCLLSIILLQIVYNTLGSGR